MQSFLESGELKMHRLHFLNFYIVAIALIRRKKTRLEWLFSASGEITQITFSYRNSTAYETM